MQGRVEFYTKMTYDQTLKNDGKFRREWINHVFWSELTYHQMGHHRTLVTVEVVWEEQLEIGLMG